MNDPPVRLVPVWRMKSSADSISGDVRSGRLASPMRPSGDPVENEKGAA